MIGQAPKPEEQMSTCRFMFSNLIPGPSALGVSSARPGMVGSPAAEALGSATCLAAGEHTGALDQVLVVEIDSLAAGDEVGLATFRWKRESAGAWEATGVPTSLGLTPLADGVSVKWVPGPGQEFYKGDRWSILATGCQGPQALMDRDRDTAWRSLETAGQFIEADLGQAQEVRALVLADHNLGESATATLKARGTLYQPVWSYDPGEGGLTDSLGQSLGNGRATPRTFIEDGTLAYAEAGESCFEGGMLSLEPAAINLLSYSEGFDEAAWVTVRTAVSAGTAAAPDGQGLAQKLVADDSDEASHNLYQLRALADGADYVCSIFAKAGELSWLRLVFLDKGNVERGGYFNLAEGTLGGAVGEASLGIISLGGGWHRLWARFNSGTGSSGQYMFLSLAQADGEDSFAAAPSGQGLYLWGAQLEASPAPSAYCPHRGRNRLRWSGKLDASAWSLGGNALLDDLGDGSYRLQLPAAGSTYLVQSGALRAGAQHTMSLEARAYGGETQFQLDLRDDAGEHLSPVFTATSQWQRFSFTYTVGAAGGNNYVYINNGGDGYATDLVIRRVQLELGGAATAYAPTGEPGVRDADAVSFPLAEAARTAMSQGGQGCLALEWSPGLDYTAFPMDVVQALFSTSAESGYTFLPLYLYRNSAGSRFSAYDLLRLRRSDVFVDFLDGQTYVAALRWQSGGNYQVGCDAAWGEGKPYEGAFNVSAGRISLGQSPRFPMRLGRVKLWEHWLEQEPGSLLDPWEHPDHSQALTVTTPHLTCFLEESHRHWRLDLDDPANPEGLIRASLFYLGGCFEPTRTFRAGYGRGSAATRKLIVSSGGRVAGSSGALAAYYQLEFARLDDADAQGLEEMLAAVHAGGEGGLRPLFFTPFTDDPSQTLYCLPGAELARQKAPGGRWNLSLRLEEVVKSDV